MEQTSTFRLGILGGMGPLAGVLLQKLIIEATPASCDQEHLQVVCFTNPHIPDRTESLELNNGNSYLSSLIASARVLENTNVTMLVIPCNTAHARLPELRKNITTPILDMISLSLEHTAYVCRNGARIGLLATDGTLRERIYEQLGAKYDLSFVPPNHSDQKLLMDVIYKIKAGNKSGVRYALVDIASRLISERVDAVVVGCTELSLYTEKIVPASSVPIIDPLRVLAKKLVSLSQNFERALI